MKVLTALLSFLFMLANQAAFASSVTMELDFDGVSTTGGSVIILDGATITHLDGGNLFVYQPGQFGMPDPGGFCALEQIGFNPPNCKSDASIVFDEPVDNLRFETFFVSGGDQAIIEILVDGLLLPELRVNSADVVDLSEWSGIRELRLIDASGRNDAGLAYGRFSYSVTAVPLPAAIPPFILALLFLGLGSFRRNRRALL